MSESLAPPVGHDLLKTLLEAEGLIFLGVASVGADTALAKARYRVLLEEGRHGTMSWMERHEAMKYDPAAAVPGTKCLILAGLNYYQPRTEVENQAKVARYAWGRDYHKVMLGKLKQVARKLAIAFPGNEFRAFTDTSPIDERFWVQEAGAAFTARNTLSIRAGVGSWFLLGEIFSPISMEATPKQDHAHGSCPSSCHRCAAVCPTGALDTDGSIDARKCISYLTIEHKGSIEPELRPLMGNWLFGCDLCQEVCPFNLKAETTQEPEFLSWKAGSNIELKEILDLTDETAFTRRFGGSPVHRAGFQGLRRNACIVAGNGHHTELVPTLKRLTSEKDEVVAEAAAWALERLRSN